MSDHTPASVQGAIVDALDLEAFPLPRYRDRTYLQAVLDAGFDVAERDRTNCIPWRDYEDGYLV